MYQRILVAIENSDADRTVLDHVQQLGKLCGASLLLVHVADGWVARNYEKLNLRESEEMTRDRAYLDGIRTRLSSLGFRVETYLAMGDPANQLIKVAEERQVDLIAMSTHGHRFLADIIRGSTADKVRHLVKIPVLLLRAQ